MPDVPSYIQRARKLPVEIQFVGWNGSKECFEAIADWAAKYDYSIWRSTVDKTVLYIKTKEGKMAVPRGNMVIKGVDNEFYSCDPDIFKKTYAILSPA